MTDTDSPWNFPSKKDDKPKSTEQLVVDIWSKAVDTQMHFNEMSVKSRQLGLTFVAAALGLAIFFFSRSDTTYSITIQLFSWKPRLQVAEGIVLAAAAAVWAVRGLDLGVYHKMLRGAVAFGEDLEMNYLLKMVDLRKGMTQAISHFSRFQDAAVTVIEDKRYIYTGSKRKTAYDKIASFYNWVVGFLVVTAIILFAIDNLRIIPTTP